MISIASNFKCFDEPFGRHSMNREVDETSVYIHTTLLRPRDIFTCIYIYTIHYSTPMTRKIH